MGDYTDTSEDNFLTSPQYTAAFAATAAFRRCVAYVLLGLGLVVLLGSLLTLEPVSTAVLTGIATVGYAVGRAFYFMGSSLRPAGAPLAILTFLSIATLHVFFVIRSRMVSRLACDYSVSLPTPAVATQAMRWAQRNHRGFMWATRAQGLLLVLSTFAGVTAAVASDNKLDEAVAGMSMAALYLVFAISWLARGNDYSWALDLPVQLTRYQLIDAAIGVLVNTRRDSPRVWLENPEGQAWLSAMSELELLNLRTDKGLETLVRGMALTMQMNIGHIRNNAKAIQRRWLESLPQPKMVGVSSDAS